MQVLLKEFILNSFQRWHSQYFHDQVSRCAMNDKSEQRIASHMHHDEAAHNDIIFVIFKDKHG